MKKFTFIRFIEPAEREEIGVGHYGRGKARRIGAVERAGAGSGPVAGLRLQLAETWLEADCSSLEEEGAAERSGGHRGRRAQGRARSRTARGALCLGEGRRGREEGGGSRAAQRHSDHGVPTTPL